MSASEPFFSPLQRKLITTAAALAAFAVIILFLVTVVVVLARMVALFSGLLWPLAVAGILALLLRPVAGVIERRLRIPRILGVALLYLLVVAALALGLLLILPPVISQLLDFAEALPDLARRATEFIEQSFPHWMESFERFTANPAVKDITDRLFEQARGAMPELLPNLRAAGSHLLGFFGFAASLAIVPVLLFFFLLSDEEPSRGLEEHLGFLDPSIRDDVLFLVREFIAIIVSFFRGQILIALIMGVLLAAGFHLIGLKFSIALGLIIGLLNIVPFLGTIIGLALALPVAFFQDGGGWLLGLLAVLVFIAVQLLESYLLTPRIMGRQTGLHPVTIILAIFFWGTALGGILGMILAIPLTAFFATFWRLARKKYFANNDQVAQPQPRPSP
ncbi:MAG: AI-2E family transporter [Puniceicoccaceae bacterium]|nr:MAG: AI-2E family transporter [Puniceicoccaceae bacterium]